MTVEHEFTCDLCGKRMERHKVHGVAWEIDTGLELVKPLESEIHLCDPCAEAIANEIRNKREQLAREIEAFKKRREELGDAVRGA